MQVKPPSGNGNVLHEYNENGKPLKITSGDFQSIYEYNKGQLSRVIHTPVDKGWSKTTFVTDWVHDPSERTVRFREMRVDFEPKLGLASAKFDYLYDLTFSKLR